MQSHVHGFSVDTCRKTQFDPQVVHLLFVARIFLDHVDCFHVSSAQNPMYRLKVNEFAVLSTSDLCLRGF